MSEQKFALFLGCTVPVRGLNYELSARKISEKLGIDLVDIKGFSCCGFPIDGVHHNSSIAIAARNLALAEAENLDIVTLCSACTGHLTKAGKLLSKETNNKELKRVNEELKNLGYQYNGGVEIKHLVRMLYEDVGIDKLKESITKPLEGIRIAPHYGCHYIKPSNIFDGFDDPINPLSLDSLIEVTGASTIQYKDKLQCCGGGVLAIDENTSINMTKQKLDQIKKADADAMTLVCPFCNVMYDEYQPTIESTFNTEYKLPVLYYPQLLGLAMGLEPKKDLAMNKNRVKAESLFNKIDELLGGG